MTDKEDPEKDLKKAAPTPEAPLDDDKDNKPGSAVSFIPTDPAKGLTDDEVLKARELYGVNEIPAPETPLYVIFFRQFVGKVTLRFVRFSSLWT